MACNLTLLGVLGSIFVVLLTLVYRKIRKQYSHFYKKNLTGPNPTFPVGTWNKAARKFIGKEDVLNIEKYGKVVGTFDGLTPNLLIADPPLIDSILRLNADKFTSRRVAATKPGNLRETLQMIYDDNQSEIIQLFNSSEIVQKLNKLLPRLETCANAFVRALIKAKGDDDLPLPVNDLTAGFIEDTAALSLLGIDLNADPVFRQRFVKECKTLLSSNSSSSVFAAIPYLNGGTDNLVSAGGIDYFKRIIANEFSERNGQELVESKASDLVDIVTEIAAENKPEKKEEGHEEKKHEILSEDQKIHLILATVLTLSHWTKNNLIFAIHAMSRNPLVQNKLWLEAKKALETEKLTIEVLDKLTYLNAFIKEVIRSYPAEFRFEKIAKETIQLSDKIILEAGDIVTIPVFALHTSKQFHQDPETFSPERFLSELYEKQNPLFYLPHSSNLPAKICTLATKVAILKIVSKLKLEEVEDQKELYLDGFTGVPLPQKISVLVQQRD